MRRPTRAEVAAVNAAAWTAEQALEVASWVFAIPVAQKAVEAATNPVIDVIEAGARVVVAVKKWRAA